MTTNIIDFAKIRTDMMRWIEQLGDKTRDPTVVFDDAHTLYRELQQHAIHSNSISRVEFNNILAVSDIANEFTDILQSVFSIASNPLIRGALIDWDIVVYSLKESMKKFPESVDLIDPT